MRKRASAKQGGSADDADDAEKLEFIGLARYTKVLKAEATADAFSQRPRVVHDDAAEVVRCVEDGVGREVGGPLRRENRACSVGRDSCRREAPVDEDRPAVLVQPQEIIGAAAMGVAGVAYCAPDRVDPLAQFRQGARLTGRIRIRRRGKHEAEDKAQHEPADEM